MAAFEQAEKTETIELPTEGQLEQDSFFGQFCADTENLAALGVTNQELNILSRASLLGSLTCKEDVMFILSQIRQSLKPVAVEPSLPDACAMTESIRRSAMARLAEIEAMHAAKRRTFWHRLKTKVGLSDTSLSY